VRKIALTLVLSSVLLGVGSMAIAQTAMPAAPDNSAVNVRDRAPGAMTADQQSNTKSDEELTAEIRRSVMLDHSLSVMAHNVKIITANGSVTLRGPVKTEAERNIVASKALAVAGAGNVNNQLEVKGQI
jgi:hyperosmotically inducible protein